MDDDLVVLRREDVEAVVTGLRGPMRRAVAENRILAALDAPATHLPIPIDLLRDVEDAIYVLNASLSMPHDHGPMRRCQPCVARSKADHVQGALAAFFDDHPPTPPWEPSEEQIDAYCEMRGWVAGTDVASEVARKSLSVAHAVLQGSEGESHA